MKVSNTFQRDCNKWMNRAHLLFPHSCAKAENLLKLIWVSTIGGTHKFPKSLLAWNGFCGKVCTALMNSNCYLSSLPGFLIKGFGSIYQTWVTIFLQIRWVRDFDLNTLILSLDFRDWLSKTENWPKFWRCLFAFYSMKDWI